MPCHTMKLFSNFKTAKMLFASRPWEFETLLMYDKNIFFVVSLQKKAHLQRRCAFFNEIRLRRVKFGFAK